MVSGIVNGPRLKGLSKAIESLGPRFKASHFYKVFDRESGTIYVLGKSGRELMRFDIDEGFRFPKGLSPSRLRILEKLKAVGGTGAIKEVLEGAPMSSTFKGWLSYLDMIASLIYPDRAPERVIDLTDHSIVSDPGFFIGKLVKSGEYTYAEAVQRHRHALARYSNQDVDDLLMFTVNGLSNVPSLKAKLEGEDSDWTEDVLDTPVADEGEESAWYEDVLDFFFTYEEVTPEGEHVITRPGSSVKGSKQESTISASDFTEY
jgi:hypothetical protein